MRIRQSFGRQESSDSKRPLINDDTDASTLSLTSQKTPGNFQPSKYYPSILDTQNDSNDATISRNSSNASKLSRPMAVIVSEH
jgi:hypothetical protein